MTEDETQAQRVNVVEYPADKMQAVFEALKPILGAEQRSASGSSELEATFPGSGTGCTRTSGSSDWECTDMVALE